MYLVCLRLTAAIRRSLIGWLLPIQTGIPINQTHCLKAAIGESTRFCLPKIQIATIAFSQPFDS
jgi:hypothetical protein